MTRLAAIALVLALPLSAGAQEDAKPHAQEILDKGAALFDTRDAAAMAATYTEDAQILWIHKDNSSPEYQVDIKKGRGEIEAFYREAFKNANEKTTSRNLVESARLLAPDLMLIEGLFHPNVANPGKFPFVQVRVKQGDKWLLKTLQFFVVSQE